MGLSIKGEEW